MSDINIGVSVDLGGALGRLKQLSSQVAGINKHTTDAAKGMVEFNRSMFGATAFIGLFTQAFRSFTDNLSKAGELDRIGNNFSKVFGEDMPNSITKLSHNYESFFGTRAQFIQGLRRATSASIDWREAMNAAVAIKATSAGTSIKTITELIARASVAAKMANKDSTFGIKQFTMFLKDGSLAHLEKLNLLKTSDPALKMHMAILNKVSGVAAGAVTATAKLAMGLSFLRAKTEGAMFGVRDLKDTLDDAKQSMEFFKGTLFTLLGKALQPLIEKFTDLALIGTTLLEDFMANKKEIMFFAKSIIVATSALAGLILVVGLLKLSLIAVTSIVGGLPMLVILLSSLAIGVKLSKTGMKDFIDVLHGAAAIFKGVFQLVHSFLSDQDNFANGIGKMDKSTRDFLESKGLLGITTNIARVISIIGEFVIGVYQGYKSAMEFIEKKIDIVSKKFGEFFGKDTGAWARSWLDFGEGFGKIVGKILFGITALKLAVLAAKGLGKAISFLSFGAIKFGGKAGTRDGSAARPFYVKLKDKFFPSVAEKAGQVGTAITTGAAGGSAAGGTAAGAGAAGAGSKLGNFLKFIFKPITGPIGKIGDIILDLLFGMESAGSAAGKIAGKLGSLALVINLVLIAGSALVTIFKEFGVAWDSLSSYFTEMSNLLSGFGDRVNTIASLAGDWLSSIMASLGDAFAGVGLWIQNKLSTILPPAAMLIIGSGLTLVGNIISTLVQKLGEVLKFLWEEVLNPLKMGKNIGLAFVGLIDAAASYARDNVVDKKLYLEDVDRKVKQDAGINTNKSVMIGPDAANTVDAKGTIAALQGQSQVEVKDTLRGVIDKQRGDKKQQMENAYFNAMQLGSDEGTNITVKEMERIMNMLIEPTKEVANNTKPKSENTKTGPNTSRKSSGC